MVAGTVTEEVQRYRYIGTWIEQTGYAIGEIRTKIEMVRASFIKMKKIYTSRDIRLRIRMLCCNGLS